MRPISPVASRTGLAGLSFAFIIGAAATTSAQSDRTARFLDDCHNNRDRDAHVCETRDYTLPAGQSLTVDGGDNGGVTVHAWDRTETKVTALIEARAETQQDADALAKQITVRTNAADVRADGPETRRNRESWSVSYEIWTPRHTELQLSASNGGIAVDGMDARMDLETVNGGLNLTDVAGDVRGTTVNGGVTASLSGARWTGAGLDLRTSNGGVRLSLPSDYSAQLETSTVNGGMNIGFPITVQGSISRRLETKLGSGGPTIRVVTTNGGVTIRRR
ncbi:MAG TPA: DUF4097 family beta strand repeat-containing protein [Gemmatimonadaceae bacterium]|jgi:DUF4097 and DUF4098 domain-containing protein YvlB